MQFTIEKDRSQISVLVIEDEDYARECISDFLELVGFSSVQAANGREGIEMFGQHEPDVVITDIKMPEMDGFDILKFLQSYAAETPVIVISGTESLDDVTQCLKLGAWDYIIKPVYDYGVVEMSILRVLEKKQLIEENRRYKEYLEGEVIKRSDELLRGSVRFKTLFNLASDVMFIYDQNGAIIDCNEMAVRHTGYNRKTLLEMNMKDLVVEDDADLFAKILAKLPMRNSIMYESRFKREGGAVSLMEQHATMITTETSPLMLVVCRDITERRRMELEREELKNKIVSSQKMELVGLLAGGIAHDFNNVLTALTGYISLLQSSLDDSGQAALYAQKIGDIAAKGEALTGRLMSFIRKKRDELAPVDVHKALKETESLLRPNSPLIKISLALEAGRSLVLGDESQLQSAFLNLGLNARDAMPEGGKLVFRTYNDDGGQGSDKSGGYIYIEVADTGSGIDGKNIKKIFEPLFTTKAPGEGTGLGLSGVQYCVNNLHGTIDVESEVGKGTTFKIALPLFTQDSQREIDLSGKEALVVTGNDEAADMLAGRLAQEGVAASRFKEAARALSRIKDSASNVAVIIVDCELPMFDENSFADGVSEYAPDTLIIKTICKDRISLGSNKDIAAFVNTPIDSDRFFESIRIYIRDLVLGTGA